MNDTSKIWKWMVIVLTILNVALIVSIWCNKPRHEMREHPRQGPPGPMGGGPADLIIHELKFTPEQIKQFETLRDEHRSAIKALKDEGHKLRDDFFALLKNDTVNENSVTEKAKAIADNQQGIESTTFHHFQKVRAICNEEQKKHFDEIIDDILMQMGGPQGKPGQGPPPPPHP